VTALRIRELSFEASSCFRLRFRLFRQNFEFCFGKPSDTHRGRDLVNVEGKGTVTRK